jgi:hypothetical protein
VGALSRTLGSRARVFVCICVCVRVRKLSRDFLVSDLVGADAKHQAVTLSKL